jgi:hypothetical protein
MKKLWKIKMIFFVIASVVAMAAIVMWLWNWLIPDLFQGPTISFWQSLGLMLLARILFRGFHGMKGGHYRNCGDWKEKWEKMSPEQKEKMRALWKKRCGSFSCDETTNDIKKDSDQVL